MKTKFLAVAYFPNFTPTDFMNLAYAPPQHTANNVPSLPNKRHITIENSIIPSFTKIHDCIMNLSNFYFEKDECYNKNCKTNKKTQNLIARIATRFYSTKITNLKLAFEQQEEFAKR